LRYAVPLAILMFWTGTILAATLRSIRLFDRFIRTLLVLIIAKIQIRQPSGDHRPLTLIQVAPE
jgi:hypothetical protein